MARSFGFFMFFHLSSTCTEPGIPFNTRISFDRLVYGHGYNSKFYRKLEILQKTWKSRNFWWDNSKCYFVFPYSSYYDTLKPSRNFENLSINKRFRYLSCRFLQYPKKTITWNFSGYGAINFHSTNPERYIANIF